MKDIKVLGTGCRSCRATIQLIETRVRDLNIDAQVTKIEDIKQVMQYGVMSTPAVVVDGVVVHAGGVPGRSAVDGWLQ